MGWPLAFKRYVAKRVLTAIITLWLTATFNFVFLYSEAGIIGLGTPPEIVQLLREGYGYGGSPLLKYFKYLQSMFTFGVVSPYFGWSFWHSEFVATGIARVLPVTLLLIGSALLITITLGIFLGAYATTKRGKKIDVVLTASSIFTWCIPTFVFQSLVIVLVLKILWDNGIHLIRLTFSYPTLIGQPDFLFWLQVWWRLLLPILTMVAGELAYWIFMTRNLLLDTLTEDYIVTARAKGVSESKVVFKHGFRSIYPQIATMIMLSLPTLITGSIMTELIFGIDGIGRYFLYTFRTGEGMTITIIDSQALQAVIFIYATLIVAFSVVADIVYGFIDPRIRVGERPQKR